MKKCILLTFLVAPLLGFTQSMFDKGEGSALSLQTGYTALKLLLENRVDSLILLTDMRKIDSGKLKKDAAMLSAKYKPGTGLPYSFTSPSTEQFYYERNFYRMVNGKPVYDLQLHIRLEPAGTGFRVVSIEQRRGAAVAERPTELSLTEQKVDADTPPAAPPPPPPFRKDL